MVEQIKILFVDDESPIRLLAEKELSDNSKVITTAASGADALSLASAKYFDVIVLDIKLPDLDGLVLLERLKEILSDSEIIMITGHGNIENAVEAMKKGAYDYITKPFELERLELVINKAFQKVCLQRENRLLRYAHSDNQMPILIGQSSAIEQIRKMCKKVATTDVPVLITGESGTGKEVIARFIHTHSLRKNTPLIIKNCGTLQKELIRSELFGYVKGAFTGAIQSHEGLIGLAQHGTLFLDEIGEIPLDAQSSLLRLLENRTYRRVGDKQERFADIRFLFATNRNLSDEVKKGNFNEALFHRINVFKINIPPLRDRPEDIPLLVEHFLHRLSLSRIPYRLSDRALRHLLRYNWPGNVRELRNTIERGIILAEDNIIDEHHLPVEISFTQHQIAPNVRIQPEQISLEILEKQHIEKILESVRGNKTRAANILGISRRTLYRKLTQFNLL